MLEKIYNKKVINSFLITQPFIDVLTYFFKEYWDLSITIGMIIRFLFLIYIGIYLIFYDKENKKLNYLYFALLILAFSLNIGFNYFYKDAYNMAEEFKNIIKILYFPITLFFFLRYNKNNKQDKLSTNILLVNAISIAGILFISKLVGTEICTYDDSFGCISGNSGWFYSANELSSILLLILAAVLYEVFSKKEVSFIKLLALAAVLYSILTIGTKSAYIGLVAIMVGFIFLILIEYMLKKDKTKLKNIGVLVLLLVATYFITPAIPVCYNNSHVFQKYGMYCQIPMSEKLLKNGYSDIINNMQNDYNGKPVKTEEELTILLNGRADFLNLYKKIYKNTDVMEKLVGLGYKNLDYNGTKVEKIIERDFHDLFYEYGILGFVVVMAPLLYFLGNVCLKLFKKPKELFTDKSILLIGMGIVLLGAFVSGHVLFSPAVVIYLAFFIGTLNIENWSDKNAHKK